MRRNKKFLIIYLPLEVYHLVATLFIYLFFLSFFFAADNVEIDYLFTEIFHDDVRNISLRI